MAGRGRDYPERTRMGRVIRGVREIPLTRGAVALIDEAVFEALPRRPRSEQFANWNLIEDASGLYYARGYMQAEGGAKSVLLHRFIMRAPAGVIVDHADGDGLNCRRSNLRFATPSQSSINRVVKLGPSGYRGVRFIDGAWRARVRVGDQRLELGPFKTAEEAARGYDVAAMAGQGDFAVTNAKLGLLA